MSQAWKRVWKRDDKVWTLCNVWDLLVWMLADMQTNDGSLSVHEQWFSCQNSRADDCNVII